jgi:hypothetical protein
MDASSAVVGLKFGILAGTATALGSAAVLWLGAVSVLEQRLSVGELLVFIAYLGSYMVRSKRSYTRQEARGSAAARPEGAGDSSDRTEVADAPGARLVGRLRGHVRLEQILRL